VFCPESFERLDISLSLREGDLSLLPVFPRDRANRNHQMMDQNFSEVARPLSRLMGKNPWKWSSSEELSFRLRRVKASTTALLANAWI
jgi:hypothetical protein